MPEDLWIAGGSLHLVSGFEILLFFVFIALHPPWRTADGGIIMNGSFVKKKLLMASQYKNHLSIRTQDTLVYYLF